MIGSRKSEQLEDNLASTELELGDNEIAAIERIGRLPLLYPYWHQHKHRATSDRLGPADRVLHDNHVDG